MPVVFHRIRLLVGGIGRKTLLFFGSFFQQQLSDAVLEERNGMAERKIIALDLLLVRRPLWI